MGRGAVIISQGPATRFSRNHSTTWKILLVLLINNFLLEGTSSARIPAVSSPLEYRVTGNIGCLFGKTLCDSELEWCYDDYAFGRCLPVREETVSENDMYRYDLSKGDMHMLEKQMERLFAMGYRWGHAYTQCVLQNLLDTIRHGTELDEAVCLAAQDQDLEGALKAFEDDVEPWNLAFIKFSPSSKNPHSDFADETYRPPKESSHATSQEFIAGKELFARDSEPGVRLQEKLLKTDEKSQPELDSLLAEKELENTVAQVKGKSSKGKGKGGKGKNKNKSKLKPEAVKKSLLNVEYPGQSDNFNGVDIGSKKKNPSSQFPRAKILEALIDNNLNLNLDGNSGLDQNGVVNQEILQPRIFSSYYNTPDSFRLGIEESWKEPAGEMMEMGGLVDGTTADGVGYEAAPGYRNDERDYRAAQEELKEEEDREIGKAVATLQAQQLLQSLLQDNANLENEGRPGERLEGLAKQPGLPLDILQSMGPEDTEDRDTDLLYTEGGLVLPGQERPFREGDLIFPKRFSPFVEREEEEDQGEGQWGTLEGQGEDEDVLVPVGDGNEILGYEIASPFFLLNRNTRDGFGFERRERLDVKKPGPWYRTVNNYAFDKLDNEEAGRTMGMQQDDPNPEFGAGEGPADMMEASSKDEEKARRSPLERIVKWQNEQQVNKKSAPVNFESSFPSSFSFDDGHFDIIDTSYANVFLDRKVDWNTAKNLVDSLSYALDLDRTIFTEITVNNDIVTFKVEPNDKGWNATEVARRIQNLSGKLEAEGELGLKILKADVGIGANSKAPSVLALYEDQDPISNKIYITTFAVCGLVAAVLVASVAIFLVRKYSKSKEKLVRLSQDEGLEATKDYQDLCRARMAGSKNNEKMEPMRGPAHKIASKESENGTNSSRSSTSSWSEEPVLSNMDISTGHMVLSYMEEHLKDRSRMEKEWSALCAYEADPCSTAVAEKAENSKKNRYSNSLPFDHSRVVLNDLANVNGSDYINASTITDHDPRNPAYIATQGPLPNTAADFWQMVWEQGSVVIVNLTRLNENNTALCHRYWPEEGSELHHIYEVHLVSEHIWCDEYLVRSFYLKNLKTGETRTVTQFHFLAWPENGIPQSTKALLEFRRKVNKSYRGRSCPIIVHCSDGAGRTGTYCLIDMVLNRMTKGAKEIDIAASLEHIRDQRPRMVRTKQQFEFVLQAVAEEVHAILKALPQ